MAQGKYTVPKGINGGFEGMKPKQVQHPLKQTLNPVVPYAASKCEHQRAPSTTLKALEGFAF